MRKLLTFKELLAIANVSEPTGRRYIASGNLPKPVSSPGRKLLFRPEDVEAWLAAGCQQQSVPNIESPTERKKRHTAAMKFLKQKGIVLPSQK